MKTKDEMLQDIYDSVLEMWWEAEFKGEETALRLIDDIDKKFREFADTYHLDIKVQADNDWLAYEEDDNE